MSPVITLTRVSVLDLESSLRFHTDLLGFEVRVDAAAGPEMRWLTVAAPGSDHELLLAAVGLTP